MMEGSDPMFVQRSHCHECQLQTYGVPSDAIERERFAMAAVEYARTDDRSTVGVLTDLQYVRSYR